MSAHIGQFRRLLASGAACRVIDSDWCVSIAVNFLRSSRSSPSRPDNCRLNSRSLSSCSRSKVTSTRSITASSSASWRVICAPCGASTVTEKTRDNSAASIMNAPDSSIDAEILPVLIARSRVDLLLLVARAACVRFIIMARLGSSLVNHAVRQLLRLTTHAVNQSPIKTRREVGVWWGVVGHHSNPRRLAVSRNPLSSASATG